MKREIFFLLLFIGVVKSYAQHDGNEKVIVVKGNLFRAQDSSSFVANVVYEKLPYYDDMGIASSNSDGEFTLHLLQGREYILNVNKSGYKNYEKSFVIDDTTQLDLYIEEDNVDIIKLDNLIFATASDRINEASYKELYDLSEWLRSNPQILIQLEGHTDFRGSERANMELSQARVEAVKSFLIKNNIKKNRISTKAFGGTLPITVEDTPEARSKNRRVEVRILKR